MASASSWTSLKSCYHDYSSILYGTSPSASLAEHIFDGLEDGVDYAHRSEHSSDDGEDLG